MKLFIFLIIFLYISSVLGQDKPEITERILPEIKPIGTTGRLNCTVINKLDNYVEWVHNEKSLTQDETIVVDPKFNQIVNGYPKYQVFHRKIGQKDSFMLVVNHLEPKDKGIYRCQIWVRNDQDSGRLVSKDGKMVVVFPPQILQMDTSSTMTVKEKENVLLKCGASGNPKPNITWVRVNGSPLPDGRLRARNNTLLINSIDRNDRGVYRCLADNNVRPPAQFDITLLVAFSPVAVAVQSSYGQVENRMYDVIIECRVAGFPEPELKWHKVTSATTWKQLKNDDKHTINILLNHANSLGQNERWFQIVIRSVTANDYGDYICEGVNNHGSGSTKIQLFATSECQGPLCEEEQRPEDRKGSASITKLSHLPLMLSLIIGYYLIKL
ncbi:unnamed protein product [Dimorphilus gyrociliatus]|uniref:Ig-like domain-containing protein n=1 Tax=Dimorphilus gyrociliatus TaxID=2664684 RepID=A0A7I8VH47_9ANNE|nr:unnamed protein product [Dimorphilus gyrociliatus]